ncbi:MAG: hypothetical protein AB7I41_14410 [Candidatus Sericytochromatia bacterium]
MKRISLLPFSLFTALSLSSCIVVSPGEISGLLPSAVPTSMATPVATARPTSVPLPEPTALGTPIPKPSAVEFSDDTAFLARWDIVDAKDVSSGPSRWSASQGVLSQSSNIYRNDDEFKFYEGTHAILKSPAELQNFRLNATIRPTDNDGFGVLFGYQDEQNFYRVLSVQDTANNGPFTRIEVKRNGVYTTLASDKIPLYEATQAVELQITVSNGQISFNVNGSQRFNISEAGFPGGRVGLLTYACSMNVSRFEVQSLN